MEIVTLVGFGLCFWASESTPWPCTLFFGLYAGHYGYRACIYPWLNPPGAAPVPFSIAGMAALFNLLNSTILGGWLFLLGPPLEIPTPRLVVGVFLFVMGFFIHVRSDAILRSLRRDLGPGYHIPSGFMYRWVSCPNYLGEIMQWFGFALAVHALPVWSFVAWTIANLLPRAMRHHQWYRERFDDYPAGRKAILPGLL